MKKYLVHLGYILIIVFFVLFGRIKANEAEKQTILALNATELAKKSAMEAERQAQMAAASAEEAARQNYLAMEKSRELEEALKTCKTGKK